MISGSLTLNSSWPPFSNLSFSLHLHPLSFQWSAISWKLDEFRVICLRRHWVITLTLSFVVR